MKVNIFLMIEIIPKGFHSVDKTVPSEVGTVPLLPGGLLSVLVYIGLVLANLRGTSRGGLV